VSLIVVGLNHRTAPVDLLERMTVPAEHLAKVLHDLGAREHLLEVVVLSTCNRIEVYARCTHFHPAVGDVSAFLADYSGSSPDDFSELLYTYYDEAAVAHLFAVAAGLDSMIVGESEILGQVREAWQTAVREGTAPQLTGLFRHAVESGKRVRTETGISPPSVSIPSAAVVGGRRAPRHVRRRESARGSARARWQPVSHPRCARAGWSTCGSQIARWRARRPRPERIGAEAIPLSEVADTLVDVDVLLSSTASPQVLIERATWRW
jgi:glutamyl-tRNA reductase